MKTTIDLPDALAHRAKEVARQHHLSLKELVTEGLRTEVERLSSAPSKARFRFRTVPGQGLESDVSPQSLTDRAYDLESGVVGPRVHDARIAALCLAQG